MLFRSQEHIAAKTTTMDPHPIIDAGSVDQYKTLIRAALASTTSAENLELYWFLLELFTEHDGSKDGVVKMAEFPSMMNTLLTTPKKHGLTVPSEVCLDEIYIIFL